MTTRLFIHIFNMSFTAGVVILFVIAVRFLLKKLPKVFSYGLWSAALFRLLCPLTLESPLSLLPMRNPSQTAGLVQTQLPQISTGIPIIDQSANKLLPSLPASADVSLSPLNSWISLAAWLWMLGIAILLIYNLISLLLLQRKLIGSVRVHANVYLADGITSPFVMGIFRPKIYLPSDIGAEDQCYVEMHEKTHIKHAHHILKLIAFSALVLHWFNPLVWAAFVLSCKDMEMMCDECVLRNAGRDVRRQYSDAILHLAAKRRMLTVLPVAFGKGNTKVRIKNVMAYHKSAVWVVGIAAITLAVLSLGLVCDPLRGANKYIRFPVYQTGKTAYNAHVYNVAPFDLYIDLPDHWEVRMPPEEDRSSLFFTPVYFYKDNVLMAICGYNVFDFDDTELPAADYYKAVYSGIRLGSLYHWDDYAPIVTSEYMETALANVYYTAKEDEAAANPVTIVPGILSYNTRLKVYVAVRFSPNAVTEAQREKIAKSIRLS